MLGRLGTDFNPKSLLGIALCGGLAGLVSFVERGAPLAYAVPLIFLLAVIPIAHVWGKVAGILAAIVTGVVFAVILFPPFGSLAVQDSVDRITLVAFELGAVAVSYLSSATSFRRSQKA